MQQDLESDAVKMGCFRTGKIIINLVEKLLLI